MGATINNDIQQQQNNILRMDNNPSHQGEGLKLIKLANRHPHIIEPFGYCKGRNS